jgi:uncharacterized protein YdaU (DUF1376 family)
MARTKPPSFDFFPDDFIAGTYHLPAEAVGIYVRLLCYQWNNGSIPSDESELARIAGVDANAMRTHMRTVMLKFMPDGCGGLKNERLEKERMHKLSIIEKAKASADRRWANKKPGNPQNQGDSDMRTHMPTQCSLLPTSYFLLPMIKPPLPPKGEVLLSLRKNRNSLNSPREILNRSEPARLKRRSENSRSRSDWTPLRSVRHSKTLRQCASGQASGFEIAGMFAEVGTLDLSTLLTC